nr:MAG TPA: hypothetical protein [Caudoviricetes sp.]
MQQVLLGANWNNSSNCSSQAANCNNFSAYGNNNCSARGTSDTRDIKLAGAANPRLGISTLLD